MEYYSQRESQSFPLLPIRSTCTLNNHTHPPVHKQYEEGAIHIHSILLQWTVERHGLTLSALFRASLASASVSSLPSAFTFWYASLSNGCREAHSNNTHTHTHTHKHAHQHHYITHEVLDVMVLPRFHTHLYHLQTTMFCFTHTHTPHQCIIVPNSSGHS